MSHINRITDEEKTYVLGAVFLLVTLWPTIAYFGVSGAIVYSLVCTFIFTSFSRLFYAWGRSSSFTLAETWVPPLFSLAATSYVSLGIYYLVQFYQTGILNGMVLYPWLAITLGGPALYFLPPRVKHYLQLRDQARNCVESYLLVKHDVNLPICVDKLMFIDGTKDRELEIYVSAFKRDDSDRDDDEEYSSLSQRIDHATRGIYHEKTFIPSGADKFYMSWYSVLEDKYYQGEFPFSFEVFEMRIVKYDDGGNVRLWDHLHRQDAAAVIISIHPNGSVHVSQHSHILICYANINNQSISDEKRENLLQHFRPYGQFSQAMLSELKPLEKEQFATLLSQRGVRQKNTCNWSMRFEGLDVMHLLDIDDAGQYSYRCELDEISILDKRPLPEKIEIMYPSNEGLLAWLYIYLDVESLERSIQLLTLGDSKTPVEFVVTIEDNASSSIQFVINSNGKSLVFKDWQTTVNEEKKRRSKKGVKESNQKKQQYELLDSAWADFRNGDFQAAEKKCNTILSKKPEVPQINFLLAMILFRRDGAATYLKKMDYFVENAGDDKSTLSRLHNTTGCVLDEEKRYAEALVYFEKASSIDPEDGMYLVNIAEIHYKLGHAKEAIKFANQANEKKFEGEMTREILKANGVMKQ